MTFEVALNEQQYKTYTLSDSYAQSLLEVVPERGGIVTRWRIQEQELFYLDRSRFTHPDLSVRGGISHFYSQFAAIYLTILTLMAIALTL